MNYQELEQKIARYHVEFVVWQPKTRKSMKPAMYDKITGKILAYKHHGKWIVTANVDKLGNRAFEFIKIIDDYNGIK